MAVLNLDTGYILKSTTSGSVKATAEFSATITSDFNVQVSMAARVFGDTIIQNGVRCTAGHNGGGGLPAHNVQNTGVVNRTNWVAPVSYTWNFPRFRDAYNITCFVQFNGEYVSPYYGFYRGSDGSAGPFVAAGIITIPGFPIYAPISPTNQLNTRNSDTQNTISWTNNPTTQQPYDYLDMHRSTDGGGWTLIVSWIAPTATSFVDSTTSPNHSYAYHVRSVNPAGLGNAYASNTTFNTPAAPTSLVASRNAANNIDLVWVNPGFTETASQLSRSSNGGQTWTDLAIISGANLTSATDAPGGGTYRYRVRNLRDSLISVWSNQSADVVTIVPPNPPTLVSPINGRIISMADQYVTFEWVHNPIDGSAQTGVELWYSIGTSGIWGGFYTGNTNVQTYKINIGIYWGGSVNQTIYWRARTRGAHTDFSGYTIGTFVLRQVPQVSIISPANDNVIIDMLPMILSWNYSDISGTQLRADLTIRSATGITLWTRTVIGTATSYTLESSEFLPDNLSNFIFQIAVTSTSTLTASTTRRFSTDYEEPPVPLANLRKDVNFGSVSIQVLEGHAEGNEPLTVSLAVFRGNVLIGNNLHNGAMVIDRYPPLDVDIVYRIVAFAATGVFSQAEYTIRIESIEYAYINFGQNYTQVLRLGIEPTFDWGTEHDREAIAVWGKREPLVRIGENFLMSGSVSGKVWKEIFWKPGSINATIFEAEALDRWNGIAIIRRPRGEIIPAVYNVQMSVGDDHMLADVSVDFERVDGDGLYV